MKRYKKYNSKLVACFVLGFFALNGTIIPLQPSVVHNNNATIQVPSFWGDKYENQIRVEIALIISILFKSQSKSFVSINGAIDTMYVDSNKKRILEVLPSTIKKGDTITLNLKILQKEYEEELLEVRVSDNKTLRKVILLPAVNTKLSDSLLGNFDKKFSSQSNKYNIPATTYAGLYFENGKIHVAITNRLGKVVHFQDYFKKDVLVNKKLEESILTLLLAIEQEQNIKIVNVVMNKGPFSHKEIKKIGSHLWLKGDMVWQINSPLEITSRGIAMDFAKHS